MSKTNLAAAAGILAAGAAVFFGSWALTDRLDGDSSTSGGSLPRVVGIAATPTPSPPAWPPRKSPSGPSQGPTDSGGANQTEILPTDPGSPEIEEPADSGPTPPPSEPPDESSGQKSGSGWVEEGQVGG